MSRTGLLAQTIWPLFWWGEAGKVITESNLGDMHSFISVWANCSASTTIGGRCDNSSLLNHDSYACTNLRDSNSECCKHFKLNNFYVLCFPTLPSHMFTAYFPWHLKLFTVMKVLINDLQGRGSFDFMESLYSYWRTLAVRGCRWHWTMSLDNAVHWGTEGWIQSNINSINATTSFSFGWC